MKKYLIFGLVLIIVFSVGVVLASKPVFQPAKVIIPERAIEVTSGVFSLGTALDYNGQVVEGYAFVDYKKGFGKPIGCNNDGKCQGWENSLCADCAGSDGENKPNTSSCYGFLAKGAKWRIIEPYLVNSANTRNLSEVFIIGNLAANINKWEIASGFDILGDEISGIVDGADLNSPDNKNEVYFADIGQSGAIGVTIVWGVFSGPPHTRKLVEWDQVYDDTDFDWSISGEAGKMDFENIATHELGHSVGLNDLYEGACSEETMYGYASYGEIKKRSLEAGDIIGVKKLYNSN